MSACFVTIESTTVARVAEMFTHPLYRARGLATTEIASSMNKLIKRGFSKMTAWVPANDDVTRRLFGKLGFKEDGKLAELTHALRP